ncbi:MAG TPA: hypothetical protein PK303_02905, partial [bacterium]|nr:hypothetical protein [bacterium]HPP08055.1 hypothetical protein [bacterium]
MPLFFFGALLFHILFTGTAHAGTQNNINEEIKPDITDVILCLRQSIGLDIANIIMSDMDGNGIVDIADVILVLKAIIASESTKRLPSEREYPEPVPIRQRAIAVINNSTEGTGSIFSLEHALKVAGVPYVIANNISNATGYSIIITTSTISSTSFANEEKNILINFVESGGILIAPGVSDPYFYPVFGISGNYRTNTRYMMRWNVESGDPTLNWFDHQNEKTISLGNPRYP